MRLGITENFEEWIALALFSSVLFASAALLIIIEPLISKMILPLLGGAPAVWNTCMVFFQLLLLAGYTCVYVVTRWLQAKWQAIIYFVLILIPLMFLPVKLPQGLSPPVNGNPIFWLLMLLFEMVGIPFFILSMTAPMLQKWFSTAHYSTSHDPYFLYSASNAGSLIALLAYPVLLELNFSVQGLCNIWMWAYRIFAVLIGLCLVLAGLSKSPAESPNRINASSPLKISQKARWILLSFIPSSLLLGLTTYITTDVASVPLFWIIPLVVYLVSFVLVFSRKTFISHQIFIESLPATAIAVSVMIALNAVVPFSFIIPYHLLFFFMACMFCHGQLVKERPVTDHLAEFYLCLSFGGFLGGAFNALIAPLVFREIIEYPLMVAAVCLVLPGENMPSKKWRDYFLDLTVTLGFGVYFVLAYWCLFSLNRENKSFVIFSKALIYGSSAAICFMFRRKSFRLASCLFVMAGLGIFISYDNEAIKVERSFFGVSRVKNETKAGFHSLIHGTTIHGVQSTDPSMANEPLSYFHREGPVGRVFEAFNRDGHNSRVAIIGLGAGSLAAYAMPGQDWTFYEIDPVMQRIATDPRYFTFLKQCKAPYRIVLGDGRLSLQSSEDKHYGLILVDAFSSDSIPIHLMTRQAMELYFSKLADDGLLAFHISNRHLKLELVFSDLARALGYTAIRGFYGSSGDEADKKSGKLMSHWIVMARNRKTIEGILKDPRWSVIETRGRSSRVWTDDYSNILSVL